MSFKLKTAQEKGKVGERIVANALKCDLTPTIGYDLTYPKNKAKIEVRIRTKNTDGKYPRYTVNALKMNTADFFVGVHFDDNGEVIRAFLISKTRLMPLYLEYQQSNDKKQAHIPWDKIFEEPTTKDITLRVKNSSRLDRI